MNKQFKKIIIMFVMVLGIMSVYTINAFADDSFEIGTSNLNNTVENSAKVGDILKHPEKGWKRYDDNNQNIEYTGSQWNYTSSDMNTYNGTGHYVNSNNNSISFYFYGTKIRIIDLIYNNRCTEAKISIDDIIYSYNPKGSLNIYNAVLFEKSGLKKGAHKCKIYTDVTDGMFSLDAIDVDGEILPYTESISLDKQSLSLKEDNSKKLTATTTPAAVDIEWISSDETVATVDSNGNVKAIKEGQATITAQIKGTDIKAICEVTVTKEDIVEPDKPEGDGSLYIEMVDGNIKRADKSQIDKFKGWFLGRDLDETESPIFKITNAKGNAEYLVHDKVVGFEIREN